VIYELNHVGGRVRDLDASLTSLGYTELTAPRTASSGQGRLAFIADPNGVRVELLQRSEDFRIPPIASGPVRRLSYVALAAPDLEAAVEFYGTHLGLQRVPSSDSPTFRIGADAVKLLPAATTPIDHLAVAAPVARPDAQDPDGNRVIFQAHS
jgi:catechol 2,3-dioxygenase-like lactoylglutathione lyase family enzyme